MARSKSSAAWLSEHVHDHWVHKAKAEGWRSRAVFKLMEIDDRDHLLRPGAIVVDLGASPGGWCQLAARRLAASGQRPGRIIAVDLLEMAPIPGVEFIQGDFTQAAVVDAVQTLLGERRADLVLCDMAPNLSGVVAADQARSLHLAELALEFALGHLQPDGAFLVKVFQGSGFEAYRRQLQSGFSLVATRKPKASRDRSSEVYLLARGLKSA